MEVYNVTISNDEMKDKYKVSVHNDKEKSILEYKEKDETLTAFDYLNNILKRNESKEELINSRLTTQEDLDSLRNEIIERQQHFCK